MSTIPGLTPVTKHGPAGARGGSRYQQVQDQLGSAICGGVLSEGTVISAEELGAAIGASHSTVRESTRVLVSLGLLRARQRIGFQVLPESEWNHLDAQVIRWRLRTPDHDRLVQSLLEIRIAIEPEAARLAAERGDPETVGRIMRTAGELWAGGDQRTFVTHDTEFHRLVMQASGNPLFARLSDVVAEALRERALHHLVQLPVNEVDRQLHVDLAHHIQRRDGDAASATAREIVVRNRESPAIDDAEAPSAGR
ncbi:FadR/GntR family transcriptional regulator [Microbacterium tumbae]